MDKKYLYVIVAIFVVIFLAILFVGFTQPGVEVSYTNDKIELYDIGSDIGYFAGGNAYQGNIYGKIGVNEYVSGALIEAKFYDSNSKRIDEDSDEKLVDVSLNPGDNYKFEVFYYDDIRTEKPSFAEITVYDGSRKYVLYNAYVSL